jgi:drug/metabolite transporter (DMT)-like permease
MKLNFWQWLGIALLLLGVVWYVMRERKDKAPTTKTSMTTPAAAHFLAAACPISQQTL